jgi:3-oxoacyl-[acyl-carrier protein] reductase
VVCVANRSAAPVEETAEMIRALGGQAHAFHWDLAEEAQWRAGVQAVLDRVGGIDILVNNTGGPAPGPADGQAPEVWRRAFEAMVLSVFGITDLLLPGMRERGWGRIITSTSSGVITPIPNLGLSNSLRAALHGWSKTLARDVAAQGITVNVVVPGRIATARTAFLDAAKAQREGATPPAWRPRPPPPSRWAATAGRRNTATRWPSWPASGRPTSPAPRCGWTAG